MSTLLNPDYIRRANSASHFDAGDTIEKDAQTTLAKFDLHFPTEKLTDGQKEYLDSRRSEWREIVISFFNEHCRRRANYMPVTVCGPARYPGKKMEKAVDTIMSKSAEFSEKSARFLDCTRKMLESMTPLEKQLVKYRAGVWKHGETIPASDPHVTEKLGAMLEYLENHQEHMKTANKTIRQGKTPAEQIESLQKIGYSIDGATKLITPDFYGRIGYPSFALSNNNANIKRIRDRINQIEKERAAPLFKDWTFAGGKVVANHELDRLQIYFDDRPNADLIARLKKAAFKWSPRNIAWQRQLTRNAERAAKELINSITPSAL